MLSGADIVMEMYQKGELEQAGILSSTRVPWETNSMIFHAPRRDLNPIGFLGTQNHGNVFKGEKICSPL
jgi:hypothetical protein